MEISTLNHLICMEKPTLEVFALQFSTLPEETDDLVQNTIIRAIQDSSSYKPGSNLKTWLYQLMKLVHQESNPEPLIQIKPFPEKKRLSTAQIQLGCSEMTVEKSVLMEQVNRNLKMAINNYAKDLKDFSSQLAHQ